MRDSDVVSVTVDMVTRQGNCGPCKREVRWVREIRRVGVSRLIYNIGECLRLAENDAWPLEAPAGTCLSKQAARACRDAKLQAKSQFVERAGDTT